MPTSAFGTRNSIYCITFKAIRIILELLGEKGDPRELVPGCVWDIRGISLILMRRVIYYSGLWREGRREKTAKKRLRKVRVIHPIFQDMRAHLAIKIAHVSVSIFDFCRMNLLFSIFSPTNFKNWMHFLCGHVTERKGHNSQNWHLGSYGATVELQTGGEHRK